MRLEAANLETGDVIGGRFRIERTIGQGAMGTVYQAVDTSLLRKVAVKVMLSSGKNKKDHALRRRIEREARAVAKLTSENVVRVLDVGETTDGLAFYVMEYLDGETLDALLLRGGALPIELAVGYMREALDGMAEAHEVGLVHRDFKPANLFLATRSNRPPIVKVLDFGTVKDLVANTAKLTQTGSTLGSPAYMAPEQIATEEPVTTSFDVWAIGVTFYELLTGELPFDGPTIPQVLQRVLHDAPVPLTQLRPRVPKALEAVILRCLAKDPRQRYANAGEVRNALADVDVGEPPATIPERSSPTNDVKKTLRLVGASSPNRPDRAAVRTEPLAAPLRPLGLNSPSGRFESSIVESSRQSPGASERSTPVLAPLDEPTSRRPRVSVRRKSNHGLYVAAALGAVLLGIAVGTFYFYFYGR